MSLWLAAALQAVPDGAMIDTFDLAATSRPTTAVLPRCDGNDRDDDIVVCGRPRREYRLPLPVVRDPAGVPMPGEGPSGMAALTPSGRCGIFVGERRCGKREAVHYGYGGGRDPITLLARLAGKALDPDAD